MKQYCSHFFFFFDKAHPQYLYIELILFLGKNIGVKSFTKLSESSTRLFIALHPNAQTNLAIPVSQQSYTILKLVSAISLHYILRGNMSTEAYKILIPLYGQAEQVGKLKSGVFAQMQQTNVRYRSYI
jgi:hypothetical protein